jgi:hypothetical protein
LENPRQDKKYLFSEFVHGKRFVRSVTVEEERLEKKG